MPTSSENIDALIAATPDWRGATFAKIRAAIRAADPAITEEWKWVRPSGGGAPVWELAGIVCVMGIFKDKVKVTFHQGAHLPDPANLFNAGLEGNKWRSIDLCASDTVDEDALTALVRAAVAFNLSKAKK